MNLLTVWIEVEVKTTKWVEVQCETADKALKQYEPSKGERITGMVAFMPKEASHEAEVEDVVQDGA
jgi:hypothetical protein